MLKLLMVNLLIQEQLVQAPSLLIGPSQSKELPKDLQLHFDTKELVISKESKELTRVSYRAIRLRVSKVKTA